jgi:hypothetical protein
VLSSPFGADRRRASAMRRKVSPGRRLDKPQENFEDVSSNSHSEVR